MKTSKVLTLLKENSQKELRFEYQSGKFVPQNFHITEVKNIKIDSVDCGGNAHYEEQTVVQLWSDPKEVVERAMTAGKADAIFNKVNETRTINLHTKLWIEYGDVDLPTSNYQIDNVLEDADSITLQLFVPATSCKPRDLWMSVAATVGAEKVVEAGCCQPASGCCN
ncbi:DUF6428 family protein [bacterium]|nr:DUF6428 family protein [bacterium]